MTKNNSSRVLVNVLGVPSLLLIIYLGDSSFIPFPVFSIFISTVMFLGAKEIKGLVEKKGGEPVISILFIFLGILQYYRLKGYDIEFLSLSLIISILFIAMLVEIFRGKDNPFFNIAIIVFSFVWLGFMLGSLSELRNLPEHIAPERITFVVFVSVWICDSAAFIFGKRFGKKKILPNVSPNKTWVGTIAGLFSSIIFLITLYQANYFSLKFSIVDAISIALITGIIGQFGDWAESLLKREANIKDTSNILMGHGGILDRFDSLIFESPMVLLYCKYFILKG
jgi:phosphatidate cytidylyltransferase